MKIDNITNPLNHTAVRNKARYTIIVSTIPYEPVIDTENSYHLFASALASDIGKWLDVERHHPSFKEINKLVSRTLAGMEDSRNIVASITLVTNYDKVEISQAGGSDLVTVYNSNTPQKIGNNNLLTKLEPIFNKLNATDRIELYTPTTKKGLLEPMLQQRLDKLFISGGTYGATAGKWDWKHEDVGVLKRGTAIKVDSFGNRVIDKYGKDGALLGFDEYVVDITL